LQDPLVLVFMPNNIVPKTFLFESPPNWTAYFNFDFRAQQSNQIKPINPNAATGLGTAEVPVLRLWKAFWSADVGGCMFWPLSFPGRSVFSYS
jgi:hypothetical protein